jgi:hypothetical protein
MISIIGIGNGASAIASNFVSIGNYDVYRLNNKVETNTSREFNLESFKTPDEYEAHIPDLKNFFEDVRERAQVFVMGSSMSSNYVLGILQQIRDKEIDLFYIQPDTALLTGISKSLEKITFGVLQEYARSGMFKSITLISNLHLEQALGEVPIKTYYSLLNESIFSTVHYLNYFEYSEPEIGQTSPPAALNRIRAVAILNMENLEEKWLFNLDSPRELCYYICINEERLASEGGLHKKLVDMLKDRPTNAFRKLSYAIYETEHEDFGFCVAHTNVVQEQKTLDS